MGLQTKANPYPNGNFALMLDFLEELISIAGKEKGLMAISEVNQGYEDILFENDTVQLLNFPKQAVSATIMVEQLSGVTGGILVRFKENGSDPSGDTGFGLGHQDVFEVHGAANLALFRAVSLVERVVLRVQYYQSGKNTNS